ncbi:MAG TPA: ketopantoate reductase family protein [Vicinamibacterales bacterium]|nr:ketopantoate reductase family protein [Vicinamibacterales bacterium]
MRIAVFGTGAVGGFFGGRLLDAGQDVSFIARGGHLAALQQHGLRITSPKGDLHRPVIATDDPSTVGPVDVVLFTVKLYDVESSAPRLISLIGPETVVITLQNGVEAVEMVSRHVGAGHVAGGVAYVVAVVDEPGHIRHTTADRLVFGEPEGQLSDRLLRFQEAGRRAGFVADLSPHIDLDLWVKFVRLGTWSGMTTVTRSTIGIIRQHPPLMRMMDAALDEAMAVGRARGITFPDGLVDGTQQMVRSFPFESKSSMLEDLERGRRLELPWLSGAIARMGEESGVATPTHAFINAVLLPHQNGR